MPTQQAPKTRPNLEEIYEKIKDILPEEQVRSMRPDRRECPFCGVTIGKNSSSEIDECLAGNNVETQECYGWLKCFCGSVYAKRGSKNRDTHCYIERFHCKLFSKITLFLKTRLQWAVCIQALQSNTRLLTIHAGPLDATTQSGPHGLVKMTAKLVT